MRTYSRTFEVKDYIEHSRLFGRLCTILKNSLFDYELQIESVEVDLKDGKHVFRYDEKNTPDTCELLMQQKCRGEKIKISLITRNRVDERKYEEIFNHLEKEAFTEYYPNAEPPKKKT